MAANALVKRMLGAGRRFIEELTRDSFDLSLAAWVKLLENGSWHLFLTVNEIDTAKYSHVTRILDRIPDSPISHLIVSLIAEESSWARELAGVLDRHPTKGIYHYRASVSSGFIEAYIYPRSALHGESRVSGPHGARVILLDNAVALVRQTVKPTESPGGRYVPDEGHSRLVPLGDDAALGAAIRAALEGCLTPIASVTPEPASVSS